MLSHGGIASHSAGLFSPLGKGFLTGAIDDKAAFDATDFRNTAPRIAPAARQANRTPVDLAWAGALADVG